MGPVSLILPYLPRFHSLTHFLSLSFTYTPPPHFIPISLRWEMKGSGSLRFSPSGSPSGLSPGFAYVTPSISVSTSSPPAQPLHPPPPPSTPPPAISWHHRQWSLAVFRPFIDILVLLQFLPSPKRYERELAISSFFFIHHSFKDIHLSK